MASRRSWNDSTLESCVGTCPVRALVGAVNLEISLGLLAPLRRDVSSDSGASPTHPVIANQSADYRRKDSSRFQRRQMPIAGDCPVRDHAEGSRSLTRRVRSEFANFEDAARMRY